MSACEHCDGAKCKGECQTSVAWTQKQAISFCTSLEGIAPAYGAHVALTGGLLYRSGKRKDCDVVIYRHGGWPEPIDRAGLQAACESMLGMITVRATGRVYKMLDKDGKQVDLLFHDTYEAAIPNPNQDGSST